MANIEDFGEKIGGAKKELWKGRGLQLSDIADFNDAERNKHIKKDNIWPKLNYEEMFSEGYSRQALYFIKTVRDAIPAKPILMSYDNQETINRKQEEYIQFIEDIGKQLLSIRTSSDIDDMGVKFFSDYGYVERRRITEKGQSCISNRLYKAVQMSSIRALMESSSKGFLYTPEQLIRREYSILDMNAGNTNIEEAYSRNGKLCIAEKLFGSTSFYYGEGEFADRSQYTEKPYIVTKNRKFQFVASTKEEAQAYIDAEVSKELGKEAPAKERKQRKSSLVPKQLEHVKRVGEAVHSGNIEGKDFINTFGIRGGEFGNWLNEKDRQTNMNFAYDSLKDMATALGIEDKDIGIGGRLNLAFGARGSGNALAHYEPLREVINLTKMKGAYDS